MTADGDPARPTLPGRIVAFDYGTKRIGVAMSDPLRITASPLMVLDAATAIEQIPELIEEYQPNVLVVGLPLSRRGGEGPAVAAVRRFGDDLGALTGLPVEYVDERFTTHTAEEALLEGGIRRRDRRRIVDKVAAAVILRQYLDRLEQLR